MKNIHRNTDLPVAIYILEDADSPGDIRYVGQTQSPSTRFTKHLHDSRRDKKQYPVCEWLRTSKNPRMRILTFVPVSEADATERRCIEGYKRLGFNLLNLTDGGSGVAGYKFSAESNLENSNRGKSRGCDHLKDLRMSRKGEKNSAEHNAAIGRANSKPRGPQTPEHIAARMAGKQRAKALREGIL